MTEDRRSARRAQLSAVHATFEGATGERREAEVFDLSRDGLFLKSDEPMAVGKRLSLDIHVAGQDSAWPALGRVVWIRTSTEGEDRPAGMAVKIIDIEDSVSAAIERLVQTREPTDRGLGARAAPPRERTILGVGLKTSPPAPTVVTPMATVIVSEPPATVIVSEPPATPVPPPAPAGSGSGDEAARAGVPADGQAPEPSMAIDLVAQKSEPDPIPAAALRAAPTFPPGRAAPADAARPSRRPPGADAAVAASGARAANAAQATPPSLASLPASAGVVDGSGEPPARIAPRRRGRGLLVTFLILAAAAIAAYFYRDALVMQCKRVAPALHRALGH